MNISVSVMSHPDRSLEAKKLLNTLCRMGFYSVSLIEDQCNDEWITGVAALNSHTDSDWHIVVQDDAIVGRSFYLNVVKAIEAVPTRSLISFYTGRVRPYRDQVHAAVDKATDMRYSWLSSTTLLWGVAIAIPTEQIKPMLECSIFHPKLKYDRRIGVYYMRCNMPVYYTAPSLVDHDYTLGSLIGNDYESEPRVAHNYESRVVKHWNSKVVEI